MNYCAPTCSGQRPAHKKVLIACSHFWPSIGGIENRLEQLGAALVRQGYEVTVLTPTNPDRTARERHGIIIRDIDPAGMIDGMPAWPHAVRGAVQSGEFQACIIVQDPLGNIIWSVEGLTPPPTTRLIIQPIINADGYSKWNNHSEFGPRLAGILQRADVVVAMTQAGPENEFCRQHGIAPAYIPNACSVPEPAGDFRQRYAIPADRFVILHVANLYWVKNHLGLLESLQGMPDSWQLVMVGNASGEPECAQRVMAALQQRPDVLYIPGLSREWVAAAMTAANVIVLSSFGEGSPNTILEAMAQGKPWLATPQCGAANDHAGGVICDVAEFPHQLRVMQQNPALCQLLGELGKQHWQHCLSWPKVVAGWIELIETGTLRATFAMPAEIRDMMDKVRALVATAIRQPSVMTLPESRHAHRWLDGLRGLEIGPAAQNPFGLNTRFVGIRDEIYEEEQLRLTGSMVHLDIEAHADNIPVPDQSEDFVLSSHVIEHCPDVISTLLEWFRIVKPGGLIYMIVPHRDAAKSDIGRALATWDHFLVDFNQQATEHTEQERGRFGHCHYHVFDSASMRQLVEQVFAERLQLVDMLERDDKIGNGFTLVYRKTVDHRSTATPWDYWRRFISRRQQVTTTNFVNIGMITYNRLAFTRQAIASLVQLTTYRHKLTVVDNASTDGTREYLQEQQRQGIIHNLVLLDENVGVAKASNLAWSLEPTAAYYLKLDNDIVIQKPGWLEKMIAVVDAIPEAGAVAYNFEPTSYPLVHLHGLQVRPKLQGNLGGACILIPQRTHQQLGYWCEDYGLYGEEDADYGYRIQFAGLLNLYLDDEEMGFHLPSGRAAKIDDDFVARDGMEETMHAEYRVWKDAARRANMASGLFQNNLRRYLENSQHLRLGSAFVDLWRNRAQQTSTQTTRPPAEGKPYTVAIFSLDDQRFACAQLRLLAPLKALGNQYQVIWGATSSGTQCTTNLDAIRLADILIVQRFYPRLGNLPYIETMLASGKPVIYELDDLITDVPHDNHLKPWIEETANLLPQLLPRFSAVTVSTPLLAERMKQFNNAVYVLPNMLEADLWQTKPHNFGQAPIVVGFAGTATHRGDLEALAPVLFRIADKFGPQVSFRFMGDVAPSLQTLPGFSFIPFAEDYHAYTQALGQAGFDIAIVPLNDNPFNRSKSNIKWLEYSACGIPGVFANLPPYNTCIVQGETGLLVDNSPDKWFQAISLLIENPVLRRAISQKAQREVLTNCTLNPGAQQWHTVYQEVIARQQVNKGTIPRVSIVIPVFNQVSFTRQCLAALRESLPTSPPCEIIVIDNASTDATAAFLATQRDRVVTISNTTNKGFAIACNQGGHAARGEMLIFLNNDTMPQPGWLSPLLTALESGAADICGARLLYPDGRCQHAGIAFDERGLGYHIFANFPGDAQPVMERRRMQAVTGACLAIHKQLFVELGGFDEGFRNGFEDVDLCLRAGAHGKQILYVPESTVIHYAEQSPGRKDHDLPNMQRFFGRWQGKIRCDDRELYRQFGLNSRREGDGRIIISPMTGPAPAVSIIIPLFNQVQLTRNCLDAVERNTPAEMYEVILVDNGSTDTTAELLSTWQSKATILRNPDNRGFAAACNQGARAAQGKYLLFLNNDTEVMTNWLQPLVAVLDQDPAVAAVGSKLLYPDDTIQHAGIIIIDDRPAGDPLLARNQYLGFPADYPPACIPQRLQALTAACLLVRKDAFDTTGGFDEGYWNGYEDVDLCFNLAGNGWQLVYQPASVVRHFESRSGAERFSRAQQNIVRLHTKWLGKIQPDQIVVSATTTEQGPSLVAGLTGPYPPPNTPAINEVRYPLVPLVGQAATSPLQRLASSSRLKSILQRYTTE